MNVVFIVIRAVVVDHEDHIFDVQTASGDGGGNLKNIIKKYLQDIKSTIERRNATSDNKSYHVKIEKLQVIQFLVTTKRLTESDIPQDKKILGVK